MAEEMGTFDVNITDDDKLWGLLCYLIWPLSAILVALMEDKKARPYIKYHAIQSTGLGVVVVVLIIVLSCILGALTFWIAGLGACCGLVPVLAMFYYAYLAYQGDYFEIPYLTEFMVKQAWLEKPA